MNKIKYIIKYSPLIYNLYFYIFSGLIRFIGFFVKTDENMILFNSFGGRKYDDSPKAIFEKMIQDSRFDNFTLIWALNNPTQYNLPDRAIIIQSNSFSFFFYALKAKVWITNSSMEKGLCFKKKNTVYINTWHGSAIKYLGNDIKKEGKSFKSKSSSEEDIFLCQSEYDENIFRRAFGKKNLYRYGLPRNDELVKSYSYEEVSILKKKLRIPENKKILLYAPTFREFTRNEFNEVIQTVPINFSEWEKRFPDLLILFRAHYEVAKYLNISNYSNVVDVSGYRNLNELMIVSDALISDYSSIFFDFSITHKPMACYAYDFELYEGSRGMYIDIERELPCVICKNEIELLNEIENIFRFYDLYSDRVKLFQRKYVTVFGSSTNAVLDDLFSRLSRN